MGYHLARETRTATFTSSSTTSSCFPSTRHRNSSRTSGKKRKHLTSGLRRSRKTTTIRSRAHSSAHSSIPSWSTHSSRPQRQRVVPLGHRGRDHTPPPPSAHQEHQRSRAFHPLLRIQERPQDHEQWGGSRGNLYSATRRGSRIITTGLAAVGRLALPAFLPAIWRREIVVDTAGVLYPCGAVSQCSAKLVVEWRPCS